jgi:hypothetical protein
MSGIFDIFNPRRTTTTVLPEATNIPSASPTVEPPTTTIEDILTTITEAPTATQVVITSTARPAATSAIPIPVTQSAPLPTTARNVASEQSKGGSSVSMITIGSVVGGIVLLSIIGIYIFRKTSLRKSASFKNRMKPKTFSFLKKSPEPPATTGVPKMEDYISQAPAVYQTTQPPSNYSGEGSHVGYSDQQYAANGYATSNTAYNYPVYQQGYSYENQAYSQTAPHGYENQHQGGYGY